MYNYFLGSTLITITATRWPGAGPVQLTMHLENEGGILARKVNPTHDL